MKRLLDPAPNRAIVQQALPCRKNAPGAEMNDEAFGAGVQTRTRFAAPGPTFRTSIVVCTSPPGRTVFRLSLADTVNFGLAGGLALARVTRSSHVDGLLPGTGSLTGEVAFEPMTYAPAPVDAVTTACQRICAVEPDDRTPS